MALTPPVLNLLAALERSGLATYGIELRAFLDTGIQLDQRPVAQVLREGQSDTRYRPFLPREEVEAACIWLADHLIGPYRQIEEAEAWAGRMVQPTGPTQSAKPLAIWLTDERFADAEPRPAVTPEEREAISVIEKALPAARVAMLRGLDDGGDTIETVPKKPDDGGGQGNEEDVNLQVGDVPFEPRKPVRRVTHKDVMRIEFELGEGIVSGD